jgi:hypothetical protein
MEIAVIFVALAAAQLPKRWGQRDFVSVLPFVKIAPARRFFFL